MRISFYWFLISFSKISLFWNNYQISAHVASSEHILVLRHLPEFISMSIFKHLGTCITKQVFLIRQNITKIENKKLFFYYLKIITAFRNQNINMICSYNIDLTQSFNLCPFLTFSVRNGPSVHFFHFFSYNLPNFNPEKK